MIKLTIFNMKDFLQTVNQCNGAVNLICPDGKKENINKQYSRQDVLQQQFKEEKGCLHLSLEILDPKDYMQIVIHSVYTC